MRFIVYIDMNIVRVGVVDHPQDWAHGGFAEIQTPRRKCILIDDEKLSHLAGYSDFEKFQEAHRKWAAAVLSKLETTRETQRAEAIPVGDESFVGFIKNQMQAFAVGLRVRPTASGYELKEPTVLDNYDFDSKKIDIGHESTYSWSEYSMISNV